MRVDAVGEPVDGRITGTAPRAAESVFPDMWRRSFRRSRAKARSGRGRL